MPVYDMKCPKCGKQSTEYDENKWQCLHCGNKFVYKEESTTYLSQTNVNIQGSSLFDVEPFDPADKLRMEEREPTIEENSLFKYLRIKKENIKKAYSGGGMGMGLLGSYLYVETKDAFLWPYHLFRWFGHRLKGRPLSPKKLVGWITLCPSCKEEHSRYRFSDKTPASGPVHCKSCGKQFMLLDGKAHAISH